MLDLALGNKPGQVTGISVEEHGGNSDHSSNCFKIVVNKSDSWWEVQYWGKADYSIIWHALGRVNWELAVIG